MWRTESIPEIAGDSDKIADYVSENTKNGSIILLHVMYDGRNESIKSISKIVELLRVKGFINTAVI